MVTDVSVSFLFLTLTVTGDCYNRGSLHSIAPQQQGELLGLFGLWCASVGVTGVLEGITVGMGLHCDGVDY